MEILKDQLRAMSYALEKWMDALQNMKPRFSACNECSVAEACLA